MVCAQFWSFQAVISQLDFEYASHPIRSVQGVMSISEALMIPAQLNPAVGSGQAGRAQQMNMPTHVPTVNRIEGWNHSNWPTSLGRATGLSMGTSPFGRSVDMVDMATQLMEAGRGELPHGIHAFAVVTCLPCWSHRPSSTACSSCAEAECHQKA